jgi:uncharacterized alkaline shock family protein YloU
MSDPATAQQPPEVTAIMTEELDSTDVIRIHISVVASIVKFSALEIPGVHSVGGSGLDGLLEHLGGRKAEKGVNVSENEEGQYAIKVNLEMRFGTPLAETAKLVSRNIREKVARMTSKEVASVEVSIDGVRNDPEDKPAKEENWQGPNT